MNRYLACPLALLVLCLPFTAASQLYRWADEAGKTHYGDRIPPEYARGERAVLNPNGDVVDRRPAEPSPAQLATLQAERDQARRDEAERARQAAHDRSLTATYTTLGQLDAAYRDRLDLLDARLSLARQALDKSDSQLARARQGEVDEGDIEVLGASRAQQAEVMDRLAQRRDDLAARHQTDRQRYRTLTEAR